MYALVVVAGLLGVGVNLAARALERRVLAWHPSTRREAAATAARRALLVGGLPLAPRRRAAGTAAAGRAGPRVRARQRRRLPAGGHREPRELGSQARLAVYRTAQEALTNVRKHAHPERVELRLGYERDGTRLTVEDHTPDGVHPAAAAGDGYGITGMRERAELLGGTLTAGPTGTGFRVELWVPA
jgi:signal transduction histidine kinase